jgi:hypothetical protein
MKHVLLTALMLSSMALLSACAGGAGANQEAPYQPPAQQSSHNATQSAATMMSPMTSY